MRSDICKSFQFFIRPFECGCFLFEFFLCFGQVSDIEDDHHSVYDVADLILDRQRICEEAFISFFKLFYLAIAHQDAFVPAFARSEQVRFRDLIDGLAFHLLLGWADRTYQRPLCKDIPQVPVKYKDRRVWYIPRDLAV